VITAGGAESSTSVTPLACSRDGGEGNPLARPAATKINIKARKQDQQQATEEPTNKINNKTTTKNKDQLNKIN
jgi:hypothetical protein